MANLFKNWRSNWQILLILLFALLWRLPQLSGSFWLDEAAQALESARPLSQQLQIRDDFQPPLLHLLVHFELIFSRSEWWLRTGAALLPGLITVWVVYQIGKKVANEKVGLLAAILLASSSFHLFYSQELRPYALPAMLACLSWLVLLEVIHRQLAGKKLVKHFLIFFLLSSAGLYTSYLYPFLFLTQFVVIILFYPRLRKDFLLTSVGIGLTFVPWLPSFLDQLHAGQSLRQNLPGWQEVVSFNQVKALLLIFGKFTFGILDLQVNSIFLILTFFFVTVISFILFSIFKKTTKKEFSSFLILASWLILPILLAWLVSFFVPLLQPKRVLFCLPAFYLALSWTVEKAFASSQKPVLKKIAVILFCSFFLLNLYSSLSYFTQPKYQREDWRSLHSLITSKYSPGRSIAAFAFPAPFAPWQWYDDGKYPTFATGELTTEAEMEIPNGKILTQYQFVLVFDYLRDLTDPQRKLTTQLEQYGYHEVDRITPSTQIGFVRVYAKTENVIGLAK